MSELRIEGLRAEIEGKPILQGVDLVLRTGEIHALMGPNGSGKSTLAHVLMGHPSYTVTGGRILLDGENILDCPPEERAARGLFLGFQYPAEISGLATGKFIKRVLEKHPHRNMPVTQMIKELKAALSQMGLSQEFINRSLNEGFSGGEKKRMELVQMLMIRPRFAILDEIDSGLDIDALKDVAEGINSLRGPAFCALVITHYQRILEYVHPDFVHIMYRGKILTSGGRELVETLEAKGYEWLRREFGIEEDEHEYVHN